MSKYVLKHGFTARCLAISHSRKLSICSSVDFWITPPWSIHLCARQLVPQALQYFRALTLLTNMAEEENSRSLSDHWLLTWLCLWDLFTEHVLLAETEVNENMASRSEETRGKAQAEKHSWVSFGLSCASSVFSFYLSFHHQLVLKTQLLTFDLTKPSLYQFFLVNPIILKLVWFESKQQEDTEFNKLSRSRHPAQYVFLQDV